MQIQPIIMAGGSGTRLWPLSRTKYPKQFLPLGSEGRTLLQSALDRLDGLLPQARVANPLVICNEDHRFLAAEQLRLHGRGNVSLLLEPVGRNTAPAVALAALYAQAKAVEAGDGDDPILLVLAADHLIGDTCSFHRTIETALPLALDGHLVTYGIVPTAPETGYGYIEIGCLIGQSGGFKVDRFVEKPDLETAQHYLETGRFLWNSGMFMFGAGHYLEELDKFSPEIVRSCRAAMAGSRRDLEFIRIDEQAFSSCPSDSIDYAVMEKTTAAAVVPMSCGWSDLGSWSSLWENQDRDELGNVVHGDVAIVDSENSYVWASSRLVSLLGVNDIVVVETKDAVLVADRSKVQHVKAIVEKIKAAGRREHQEHRETYRPWGVYDCVDAGRRYQVKRITVKPGAKLSVQMHHHRAEHWIVVSGTAKITNGDRTCILTENESTYIPIGQIHALENPGVIPLELIEVQSGAYLGEDDIVRLEDRYGRS
ncbi:mannose-1-phosphate guanylyltransferase/mannose-6-phosphate isomerase [Bordetella hinzii]|nr:mannose-1-phosphate guanylyltransferase/mannose-6-phosphate isomerase [Bordetella hinzii]